MRIDRLDLERYGHFDGTSLDLSDPGIRLHIVHGRNEAGKSTALSAICDLLFGVPHNSGMGFRHTNNALRIGGLLALPDGSRLTVKRRKGNKETLLDGDGVALPDTLLLPYLCGLDRAGFQRLFGLDHERLRAGGQAMLDARGDLSRTLFQAGSGLSGLDRIVAGLTGDADAVGSPYRKQPNKPLWLAVNAHVDATARMRNEATKAEAWEAAEAAVEAARQQLDGIRRTLSDAQRNRSRLERLRRVRPLLARLEDLARLLADAGDGPDLPDDLARQWRQAEADVLATSREAVRAQTDVTKAEEELAAAGPVPPLLAQAAPIEALYQRQGEIEKSRTDLPRREHDRAMAHQRLETAARDINLPADPAALETMLPRRPLIAGIRDKAKEHARLTQSRDEALRRHEAAGRDVRQVERNLPVRHIDPANLAGAEAATAAAGRLGEVELRRDRAKRTADELDSRLSQLSARLGRFALAPDRLAAVALPSPDAVERQRQREQALENRRERLAEDRRAAEDEQRRLHQTLRELAEGGEVPTPAAIAETRRGRDRIWSALRPHLYQGTRAPDEAVPAFEAALHSADQLADQQQHEAARVARYMRAESDLATCAERLKALAGDAATLDRDAADLAAEWAALWQPSGIDPGGPAEMAAFLTQAASVLAALEQRSQQAETVAALQDEATLCAGHLRRVLSLCGAAAPPDGDTLPALRIAAEAAITQARQTEDAASKAAQALDRARAGLDKAAGELAEAEKALAGWGEGWAADMASIGLPALALPVEADAALRAWEDIGGELRQIRELDHRIDGLKKDIAAYNKDGAALLAAAADLAAGLDVSADAAARALYAALKDARAAAARRDALVQARERAVTGHEEAIKAARRAAGTLSDLRRLHRLDEGADVPALVAAANRRRDLHQQEAALLAELHRAGDGQDIGQLRADVSGIDPDALTADISDLTTRIEAAQNDLAETSVKLREAERALEEMRHRAGIGGAAQDAADAAARAADQAGRWLRLRAASLLLTQAVERYRTRNEHPLLLRAGSILAAMAASGGNPVIRLKVDYGAGDDPVLVGVRQDGSDAHVEGMSEGLRDQLFLALRIASVEAHVAQSTPLPFIADDLFITSDEARTRAGLLALAELGTVTQVVLFTHHEYVVEAGREALGNAARVHRLAPR